jgi:hypothetical protein
MGQHVVSPGLDGSYTLLVGALVRGLAKACWPPCAGEGMLGKHMGGTWHADVILFETRSWMGWLLWNHSGTPPPASACMTPLTSLRA